MTLKEQQRRYQRTDARSHTIVLTIVKIKMCTTTRPSELSDRLLTIRDFKKVFQEFGVVPVTSFCPYDGQERRVLATDHKFSQRRGELNLR